MDKDDDNVLGLDSLDFMEDNGDEFFLASEDKATYAKTDEISNIITELKEIEDNYEYSDEVKKLIAEYSKDVEIWEKKQIEETKKWIKNRKNNDYPLTKGN